MIAFALVYRAAFVTALVALTLICWLLVGGREGALLWIASFLLLWGLTRLVDYALNGFFLGNEVASDSGVVEREEA